MYTPVSLHIVNLFSYEDVTLQFIKGRIVPVYGKNSTDPGVESNGSGKSSLVDILAIALTGSPLRKISKKSILRRGENSGHYELLLQNDVTGHKLLIKEFCERNKSNKVEIYDNDILNKKLKDLSPDVAHKYILQCLDISADDLLNYYLLGRRTYTSFFSTKDSAKKEVINRFSKADIVDPIDDWIKADINTFNEDINLKDQSLIAKNAKIEVLQEQINEFSIHSALIDQQERVARLEAQIVQLSETNETLAKEVTGLLFSVKKCVKELKAAQFEIDEYNKDVEKVQVALTQLQSDVQEISKLILEIEHHLADEIECPKCHHKFCFKDKEYNIKQAIKELPGLKETKIIQESQAEQCEENIRLSRDKKRVLDTQVITIERQMSSLNRNVSLKEGEISDNEEQITKLLAQIDEENAAEIKDTTKPLKTQIATLNKEIDVINKDKDILVLDAAELTTWRQRFKKFKSYLANNSISMIQSLTNGYLYEMGTHLQVSVEGFREKADGTLKEEITAEVTTDGGITSQNYFEFSGGEQAKIDIAGVLAMQKIINLNSSGGLDLLLIDEIIDSCDRVALGHLITALDKIKQTILLISHIELPTTENSIKIEKKLGISRIVKN